MEGKKKQMFDLGACICTRDGREALAPQCTDCTPDNERHRQGCINTCFSFIQNAMYVNCPRVLPHITDAENRLKFHVKRLKGEGKVFNTCQKMSLLILACKFSHQVAVKYLLTESSILTLDPKPTDVDISGKTAFDYAFKENKLEIVKLLFERWTLWPFDSIPDIMKRCTSMTMNEIIKQTYIALDVNPSKLSSELKSLVTKELSLRAIHYRAAAALKQAETDDSCKKTADSILQAIEKQDMILNNAECWKNLKDKYRSLSDEDKVKLIKQCFKFLKKGTKEGVDTVITRFHILEEHLMKEKNNRKIWEAVSDVNRKYGFLILGCKHDREELINYLVNESSLLEFCRILENPYLPTDMDKENMRAIDYAILHDKTQMVKILMSYWPEWPFDQPEPKVANARQCINMERLIERGNAEIYKSVSRVAASRTDNFIQEEIKFRAFNRLVKMAAATSEKTYYLTSEQTNKQSQENNEGSQQKSGDFQQKNKSSQQIEEGCQQKKKNKEGSQPNNEGTQQNNEVTLHNKEGTLKNKEYSQHDKERLELTVHSIEMSLSALIQYLENLKDNNTFNEAKHWILQFVAENIHTMRKIFANQESEKALDELEFTVTSMLLPLIRFQQLQVEHNRSRQFILDSANDYTKNEKYIITEDRVIEYQRSTETICKVLGDVQYLSEARNSTITMLRKLIDKLQYCHQNKKISTTTAQTNANTENYIFKYYGPMRDLIYFNNIDQYIQLALSVDLEKELKFGVLAIERVLQVTGECFKSTQMSSHISSQGQKILSKNHIPVTVFTSLRDAMSHQKAIGTLSIIESKLAGVEIKDSKNAKEIKTDDGGVYMLVQKDLKRIRKKLQNAIADVEETLNLNFYDFSKDNKAETEGNTLEEKIRGNSNSYPVLKEVSKSFEIKKALRKLTSKPNSSLDQEAGESAEAASASQDSLLKSPNYNDNKKRKRLDSDQFHGINKLLAKGVHQIDVSLPETKLLYHNFLAQLKTGGLNNDKNKPKQLAIIIENQKKIFETKEKLLKITDETEFSKKGGIKLLDGLQNNRSSQKNNGGAELNQDELKKFMKEESIAKQKNLNEFLNLCKENWPAAKNKISSTKCIYETLIKSLQQAGKGEVRNERIDRVCQGLDLDDDETKIFKNALSKFSKYRNDDIMKQRTLEIFVEGILKITQNYVASVYKNEMADDIIIVNETNDAQIDDDNINCSSESQLLSEKLKKAISIYESNKRWLWHLEDFMNLDNEELKKLIGDLILKQKDREEFTKALILDEPLNNESNEKLTKKLHTNKNKYKTRYLKSKDNKNNNTIDRFIGQILKGASNEKVNKAFKEMCHRLDITTPDHVSLLWKGCEELLGTLYDHYYENQITLLKERLHSVTTNVSEFDDLLDRMNGDLTLKVSIEILIYNILNTIKNITTNDVFTLLERIIIRCVMLAQKNNSKLPMSFNLRNELAHWNILTNMNDSSLGKLVVETVRLFVDYSDSIKDLAKLMEFGNWRKNLGLLFVVEDDVINDTSERKLMQKIKTSAMFANLKMRRILEKSIGDTLTEQNKPNNEQSAEPINEQPRITCDFIPKAYWNSVHENNEQKLFYCQDRRGTSTAPGTESWTLLHQATEFGNQKIIDKLLTQKVSHGSNLLMPLHLAALHGHQELVKYFLHNNLYNDSKSYCTPLTLAAINNRINTVETLLNHLNSPGRHDKDYIEKQLSTALLLSSKYGHNRLVQMLLTRKADIESKTEKGQTPMHLAASRKNGLKTIEILLSTNVKWKTARIMSRTTSGKTPLHVAARHGHLEIVKHLCKLKSDDMSLTNRRWTPLHYAACYGHFEVVEYLLSNKSDQKVLLQDDEGETSLHCAVRRGHAKVCNLLIEKGADIRRANNSSYLPIHIAAENGHSEIVKRLAKSKDDIDSKTENGETPLHLAVNNSHFHTVQLLIELGANIHAKTNAEKKPVDIATENGDTETVGILVKNVGENNTSASDNEDAENNDGSMKSGDGKQPIHHATEQGNFEMVTQLIFNSGKSVVNGEMRDGRRATHLAAEHGYTSLLELLLTNGAEVDHKAKDGRAPIHYAVAGQHTRIVKLLIEHHADLTSQDINGVTPLSLAYEKGYDDIVKLLIQTNANVSCILHSVINRDDMETLKLVLASEDVDLERRDEQGRTALFLAYEIDNMKIVGMLVDQKANVNCPNNRGQTIIHLAASRGDMDTLRNLSERGANVDVVTNDNWSPLHTAVKMGNFEMARFLVDKGANVSCRSNSGFEPIHYACDGGHVSIIHLLLDKGASVECKAGNGSVPLHLASGKGHLDVVKLLLEKGASLSAVNNFSWTPLSLAKRNKHKNVERYLRENGAQTAEQGDPDTPATL